MFYDKTVEIGSMKTTTDLEGGVVCDNFEPVDSFQGNVSFSNCKKIQEEYGLDYQIDISVTCDYRIIEKDNMLKYESIIYKVTDVLRFDSHVLIIGTKWQK